MSEKKEVIKPVVEGIVVGVAVPMRVRHQANANQIGAVRYIKTERIEDGFQCAVCHGHGKNRVTLQDAKGKAHYVGKSCIAKYFAMPTSK